MNNSFLSSLGLGGLDIGIILIVMAVIILILFILLVVNICSVSKLKKKYTIFMTGNTAKSLENEIVGLFEDNKFIKASIEKNKRDIGMLFKNMESTFQKIGIIKYDAFNQMGGQLSFSLVLLDKNNNGFVLNSVHGAEGCYTYTKEIKDGTSEISLGEEEKQALDMAMGI
jgi:competence protein ComGC